MRRWALKSFDMKRFVVLLFTFISITCYCQCNEMDVVVLGDFSGSVRGQEEFVIDAIGTFASTVTTQTVRVGVVLFNDDSRVISELSNDSAQILQNLFEYRDANASSGTDIESALLMGVNLLMTGQSSRKKMIILISDGDDSNQDNILIAIKQINSIGIGVCGVLINDSVSKPEFMKEVTSGCYVESDYVNLATELQKINLCL